jgi:iron complex outermembrane receptor protein
MNPKRLTLTCLMMSLASASATHAIAEDVTDDIELESVVVIGRYNGAKPSNLAGSYEIVGRDQIGHLHVDDNVELFSKLPGVSISRYNQGPINADLSIRGFDGDGTTPHAKLLIDGIPANLHNGFGELDQIFSTNIDSIQAFKGTSDVRYGLFNIAGNYQVFSRNDTDVTELETTLGSYNTQEIQAYSGHKTGQLTHNYSVGYRHAEGYRDHSELERYALNGRWFYDLNEHLSLGFISRYANFDADAPGYLTQEEAQADPTSSASYASQDGGDKTVFHNSLHADYVDGSLNVSTKLYHQLFERERWVRFSEAGSLTNRYDDQTQTGAILDSAYELDQNWKILAGASYQAEDILEQRFGTIGQTRQRDTSNVSRNYDYTLDTLGAYISIENQFNDNLKWNIGLRADKLDGDFTSTSNDGVTTNSDIYDFGWVVQPKLNLFYTVNDHWLLFLNYGESFQHPFGSSLYTTGDVNSRDVSTNIGWEIGTQFNLNDDINIRLSTWQQKAENEYIQIDGDSQNVGETERSGWELASTWHPSSAIEIWANYSAVETEIVNPSSTAADTVGNELRSIPEYTASVGITGYISDTITARMHVDSQGDYYVNEANLGGQFGGYTLTNASVDYDASWALLSFSVNNLFDEYYEYVFDFSSDGSYTIHSPGDGRNFSVSAKFSF